MTIASHTICKNGMPFIGKVLRQVAPLMDKMFIALSQHSTDETKQEIQRFIADYPNTLIEYMEEGETDPAKLTDLRNFQVSRTRQDWILFLDDDDFWPQEQLKFCLDKLSKDSNILAYSVTPYQLVDMEHYDLAFRNKSFSKFLRNFSGLHYLGDWPKDLPCDAENAPLYWKTHPKVKTLPYYFYHLSYLKNYSWRQEDWARRFWHEPGRIAKLPQKAEI